MGSRTHTLLLAMSLTAACGPPGYIELVVDSAKDVVTAQPLFELDSFDTLQATVSNPRGGETLLEASYALGDLDHGFPVVIVLEPDDGIARELDALLVGQRDGVTVANGAWRFHWQEGHINTVPVLLEPVPR